MLLIRNDLPAAVDSCRRAISLDAAPGEPYLALGNALIRQAQYEAAVEPLHMAIERLPEQAIINNSLGVALLESGQLATAEMALRRAIALALALSEGYSNLAHLLNLSHQPEGAAAHAWRAVEHDEKFAAGWINLSGALLALDQPAEALTAAERAIALNADSTEAENTLGSAYAALARDFEARAAFERAIALAPESAEIHFNHALSPLFARDDIACYGLQVGPGSEGISGNERIEDLSPRLKDFADTADAIGGLDLVISIDSAVAHLAGALGHPVWVMLSHGGDWRYLREAEDNPWYPTMRHFRQPEPGDWNAVVRVIGAALDEFSPGV